MLSLVYFMYPNRGTYVLLLRSGISRLSVILTGWKAVLAGSF